jgi:hypothetical protein
MERTERVEREGDGPTILGNRQELVDLMTRSRNSVEPMLTRGRSPTFIHEEAIPTNQGLLDSWSRSNLEENRRAIDNMQVYTNPRTDAPREDVTAIRDQLWGALGIPHGLLEGTATRNNDTLRDITEIDGGAIAVDLVPTTADHVAYPTPPVPVQIPMNNTTINFEPSKYFCPACEREITSKFSFVIKNGDEPEERFDFCSKCLAHAIHQLVPKLRPIETDVLRGTVTFTPPIGTHTIAFDTRTIGR